MKGRESWRRWCSNARLLPFAGRLLIEMHHAAAGHFACPQLRDGIANLVEGVCLEDWLHSALNSSADV